MPRTIRLPLLAIATLFPVALFVWPAQDSGNTLTIATWNLAWLVDPETAHTARLACRRGSQAALPCDVASDLSRDSADFARLAAYASELDADVVAFQEVENAAAARRVFAGYDICMADGAGVQHVGFAVTPRLRHRCGPSLDALAMDGRSRKAMQLQIAPAGSPPIELLAVHLKSGCSRDPLDAGSAACRMLDQQAALVGEWIAARGAEGARYMVLGDFNRVPPESADDPFWRQVQTAPSQLLAATLPFHNCFAGQPYWQYIDHILIGNALLPDVVAESPRHQPFRDADAARYRLSDHCPVSISIRQNAR